MKLYIQHLLTSLLLIQTVCSIPRSTIGILRKKALCKWKIIIIYRPQRIPPEKPLLRGIPTISSHRYCRFSLKRTTLPYYAPASSDDVPAPRTRVLFFTGRKLSQNLVRDFNALAAQAPEKEFWLAYNDFRNTDSAKYLAQLSPDCSSLPLKPDPEKGNRWKLASVLTSRMGLFSFYPLSHILDLGKEEYKKCMGETRFDEVVITSTDSIKTVATLLAAAPKASYTFDTFNPERYSTSRPYRHQIAFLCRMLRYR